MPTNAEAMFYRNGWVEVIGDSDACGFGVDGEVSNPANIFTMDPELEDVSQAWGSHVARALGLGCITIAWSGKGVVRNAPMCGQECLPEIWLDQAQNWAYGAPATKPAMVLMLAGGNDFFGVDHPDQKAFVSGFSDWLLKINKFHGNGIPIYLFHCASRCCSSAGSPTEHPSTSLNANRNCELLSRYTQMVASAMSNESSGIHAVFVDTQLEIPTDYAIMMHWSRSGQLKVGTAMANHIVRCIGSIE